MSEGISVFGLGYVGLITSLGLADQGLSVIGVDIAEDKVRKLNSGNPTIREPGVRERLENHLDEEQFQATTNARRALDSTNVSLICVGTPTGPDGSIDLRSVENVVRQIGNRLGEQTKQHTVVLRSTVLPGTSEKVVRWLEEASGRTVPDDINYLYQPEFMREGSAFQDFYNPPFIVFGPDTETGRKTIEALYPAVDGPVISVALPEAESIKYACNAFHALKISFANEIGRLSEHHDVSGQQVMDLLCRDRKLNISDAYLDPGFAFGGSCLPKDLKALCQHAEKIDIDLPVIQNVIPSNDRQLDFIYDRIIEQHPERIGIVGLTFKAGTDDVRESPMVKLCADLVENEDVEELRIYEPAIIDADLHGANRLFIEQAFPDYRDYLVEELNEVLERSDTLLLGPASSEYEDEFIQHLPANRHIIDTTGRFSYLKNRQNADRYHSVL